MKPVICAVLAIAMIVSGCSGKNDANAKNFSVAINQYLDKHGSFCLGLNEWPVDVTEMDKASQMAYPAGRAGAMEALASVGLVKEIALEEKGAKGKQAGTKRYALTAAAKPFERPGHSTGFDFVTGTSTPSTDLCWGKESVDKVVKWDGPMKFGDFQSADVKYLYKIDELADWAKRPEIQRAFPRVQNVIESAGKELRSQGVKLTSEGWEALGLDSNL